jgi:UDP-N-acetylmuramoyl-tripeptide--D-alanyl-D-alanine ligase
MEARPLKYLVEAVGGQLGHGDENTFFHGVSTDSRRVAPGDLFVALRGDRFDGHDYITEVEQRGAITVLVDRPVETKCAVVEVGNTRIALGKFATSYRRDYELPVIGIGGSNGKTTTKELLAAILRRHFAAIWSEASFNNSIGVPLTLLRIENFHRAAVLELGTNHPGELAPLVEMAAPRYGVITSIGREHLEFFTDVEGVAREEGVLGELLPTSGKLFLYDDSQWSNQIAARSAAPTCMVGMNVGNDWQAYDVCVLHNGVTFNVNGPLPGEYRLRLLGRHQVGNALLAIAVAAELGVPAETIREGLAVCRSPQRRLQVCHVCGITQFSHMPDHNNPPAFTRHISQYL